MSTSDLTYLHGKPSASGQIKVQPEDFQVTEDLGYQADGFGEHLLIRVRKTRCNTHYVAEALAKYLKISMRDLSYAGMKDRQAVTEQTFCLRMPGKAMPDLSGFQLEGCLILNVSRHQRKIRTGGLAGNAFQLIVRNIEPSAEVDQRLALIANHGVPNYFGEQRFGRQGHNLTMARQWATGQIQIRCRKKRSLILSATRSYLFNRVTSHRLQTQGSLQDLLVGDCVQLAGRGSWFVATEQEFASIKQRLRQHQLAITAPLPGRGDAGPVQQALQLEQNILQSEVALVALLQREKVDTARRKMLLMPQRFSWQWHDNCTIQLNFWLPAGSFATSIIREMVQTGGVEIESH